MPIGLPDRAGPGGRGPEVLARALLGARRSSVFAIPARAAVEAEPGPWADGAARLDAFRRAGLAAEATSDPPRGMSIQAWGLFPKIREVDLALRRCPALAARVFESHPELAFRRLNGEQPLRHPKKSRDGIAERRALLVRHGLGPDLLSRRHAGAGADDLFDAAALLFTAARIARGEGISLPDPPGRDAHGLPVAIWV